MKKILRFVALLCVVVTLLPMTVAFAADKVVEGNDKADVDLTNKASGFVQVTYKASTDAKVKVIVRTPRSTQYQYNYYKDGAGQFYPLSEGDGKYSVEVYTNTTGSKYALSFKTSFDVKLTDEFAPFLKPSNYVNFVADGDKKSEVVKRAAELTKDLKTDLDKLTAIYNEVLKFSYDYDKANTVQGGYIPDVDKILSSKKGICLDYAAVMTSMLRSQKIPCQLVVGYAGDQYHAWINVYSKEAGWVEGAVQFDGKTWKLMDPTFVSTGGDKGNAFAGDGKNYSAKYYY